MGAPCLRVFTLITIFAFINVSTIQAQNKPPVWDESSVEALKQGIREDTPLRTFLTQLRCVDPEGDTVWYRLIKGTAVHTSTLGRVTLNVALDFEDKDAIGYDLGFACYDVDSNGIKINNNVELEIQMTVDDANDIAPEFSVNSDDGYTFFVSEDAKPGLNLKPEIEIIDGDRGLNAELSNLYIICNSPFAAEKIDLPDSSVATCTKFNLINKQVTEGVYKANLVLNGDLDYESRAVYSSKLIAIDNPQNQSMRLSTTINIQINLVDAQDVPPLFVNLGTTSIVSEGAKKGDSVNMVIEAKDGDLGAKRPVKIVMLEDRLNAFTLDNTVAQNPSDPSIYEARLRVENALDRETLIGAYDFVVKVIELDKTTLAETDATATATYSIQVSDIDDQPPLFESPLYQVNVTEMEYTKDSVQITGLRMVCSDRDEPQNARYKVRIVSQTFADVFSISPAELSFTGTAILFLTVDNSNYLDYDFEAYRKQSVVLEAKSIGPNQLSSSTTVSITLTDINDNRPKFEQPSYDFKVSEAVSILPHVINRIKATDTDSNENGRIRYRLEGGTSNKFDINPTTGELTLVSRVDFEKTPLYVFLVYAEDQGQDQQVSQVQVTVEVTNANDQYPQFEQPFYLTSVNEDQLTFLTPINIKAFDNEVGTGTITYNIIKGQTADNAFNLNVLSGSLTLNRKLDYGQRPKGVYKLEVEASDGADSPLKSKTDVTINVIDQNNFRPVINPKVYTDVVSELVKSGTVVARILATDEDKGEFGKITYRISSGAYDNFVIDPNSGVVTVNDPHNLDFNLRPNYDIKIIGSDGGAPQLVDTATLKVDVTDANNKNPVFARSIYIETVNEDRNVDDVILTVFARDDDSTKDLFYTIIESSINARNGAGSLLTSINRYNYREALGMRGKSGELYIKNKLNKEEALEFNFIVQVEDLKSETGKQIDTTRVAITVTGEANTDLSFDRVETIFVNEGSPEGYELTTVVARDPTTQQGIRNYQQIGNISPFFEVVKATGQVRIKKEIDYEKDPHTYNIVIQALADDNLRSITSTVTIKINDDNDNNPVFERSEYITQVDEDAPPLTRIANIYATDVDTPSFGPIEYSIAGGLDSEKFELYKASRGVDVLIAREAELNYNTREYYELDIVAMDNPARTFSNVQKFSSVKLKITVIDKNNHKPKFLEEGDVRRMPVAETASIGKSVGTIVATDDDFGVNGEITFDLRTVGDPTSATGLLLFDIVPRGGIITVADSLVGYGGNIYKMEVYARDGGEPFLSNTLNIEIEVLSTENNDGNPIWYRPGNNHKFFVPEETPGHIVKENNQPFIFDVKPRTGNATTFSISDQSAHAKSFKVDKNTGVLTVVESLDREKQASYELLVYAEDTSDPLKIRTGRLINIVLTDKDDNAPTFTNPKNYPVCGEPIDRPLEVSFFEEVPKDKMVYQVSACDPDVDKEIEYNLYDANPECKQNNAKAGLKLEKDGRVITTKHIDYEQDQTFIMCVIATDKQANSARRKRAIDSSQLPDNVAYIIFHVKDRNDNGPIFPAAERSAVMMTNARDLPIIILDANDKDGKGFNVPVYSIIDTKFFASGSIRPRNPGKAFVMKNNELHPDPPRGHTFQEFSRGRFVLTIQAEDPVNPKFTDTQVVTVYVHDKGQAMKVILDMSPGQGIAFGENIVRDLNNANPHYAFRYLHLSVHESKDGIDRNKTDVCFIAVDENTHVILNTFTLVSVMTRSEYKSVLDDSSYDIIDIGKCYPSTSSEEQMKWKDLWWVLVVLAIFIGFCAICFIVIIFFMYRKYRRYMETEKTYLVPQ